MSELSPRATFARHERDRANRPAYLTGGDAVATKFFGMMKRSQEERLPYGWERCAPSTTKREELVSGGNG